MEGEASGPAGENNDRHPWPYLKEMFNFLGDKGSSYLMECILCLPKITEILAFKNSPSNLKKHVERKHTHHVQRYTELTSSKLKRKWSEMETPSTSGQTSLFDSKQTSIDKAVMKYVVQGLQPFSLVEQEPFIEFVRELQPNSSIISRPTLCSMIDIAAKEMKKRVTEAMRGVDHVATTTDCWSIRRQSFIGVTAHWIDPESLNRCSAALASKQLRGSNTFDELASALNDIHSEFEIQGKIVGTTTDNGSNFFKEFQVLGENENGQSVGGCDVGLPGNEDNYEENEEVEFIDVTALLNEDDGSHYQLPKHHRCACHLLNLVSTVDATKATSSEAYKKLYQLTFGKCYRLWNKCGRSTLAAETIQDACSLQLLHPNARRWNSLFLAVERLLRIVTAKGGATGRSICTDLQVPMFNRTELVFLMEYATAMSPVAQAVNILLADTNTHMGWLLPTINQLIVKLDGIKLSLKYCQPLVDALKLGIENRFSHMLRNPELIAASILLPKFKMEWTKDKATIQMGIEYIKEHIEERSLQQGEANKSDQVEDKYSSSLKSFHTQEHSKQLEGYLASSADNVSLLRSFPAVCTLFEKLNTPLHSSATSERLFSIAGLVSSPRRTSPDSHNFENQLLLKLNHKFFSFT
ncbi:uncharacterized protein LOC133122842 isoform X1 [Conger conger]|uniref:uncharacterized protein LOC133122842 isoform X1 n=1 Tax=Conger conger TaxID=82655 RepID=UPI002A5A48B4|nr:uncharacterized protein LOC133122842 isoform X1 [Conger conger]